MNGMVLPNEIVTIDRKDMKHCRVPKKAASMLKNYPSAKVFARVNFIDEDGVGILLMVPMLEGDNVVGTVDTGIQLMIPHKKVERVLGKFYGTDFGTVASLPESIHIPSKDVPASVKVHQPNDVNLKFTSLLTENIAAVASQVKKGSNPMARIMIFGGVGSGKTSLAQTIFSSIGTPYVIINQHWWAALPFEDLIGGLNFMAATGTDRKFGIVLDNLDELVASTAIGVGPDGHSVGSDKTAAILLHLSRIFRLFEGTIIVTTSGMADLGHLNTQTQYFFNLSLSEAERANFWEMICPTAAKMKEEIAREDLPISLMCALLKQAEAIGELHKRKHPSEDDVRCALQCFGKKEEGQQTGFNATQHSE